MPNSKPRVVKLPRQILSFQFLSTGAVGWVFKINDRIALKFPRQPGCRKFGHELEIFDILEKSDPCPDIIQSFLRVPEGNFLALLRGGTLDQRLRANQIRESDKPYSRILQITKKEPTNLVERWIMEVSNATAWLESLGYVHTDLRPINMLLDDGDHLKLTDFDCVAKIGSEKVASAPPYARILGPEAGLEQGTFGCNDARAEQFAIGSLLYLMTRGHEPYEEEEFKDGVDGASLIVSRFQRMEFPALGEGHLDRIIKRCWYGEFRQMRDMAEETKSLRGAIELPRAIAFDTGYILERRKECQSLVDSGIFVDDYFEL
jgi:serine/threonine protein kinase